MEIEIGAIVVWSHDGRCGIRFDGVVHVDEWIAGRKLSSFTGIGGQARVDAIQAAIRSGHPLRGLDDEYSIEQLPAKHMSPTNDLNGRIAEEVSAVQRSIAATTEDLSDDPLMLARHAAHLQSLQHMSEVLDHLARVVRSENALTAVEAINLQSLRARLLRKKIF